MGEVIGLIRVMPGEVLEDSQLEKMIEDIKAVIKPPAKIGSIQIKPIAFGLNAIILNFALDESKSIDNIQDKLKEIKEISSAEVIDFRRAFG